MHVLVRGRGRRLEAIPRNAFEPTPVERIRYANVPRRMTDYLTRYVDEEVAHAEAVYRALSPMRDTLCPDPIVGHAGWGRRSSCRELFPDIPVVNYIE